jgi:RNA recognition motif-containing protein
VLYVGGLSESVSDSQLRDLFALHHWVVYSHIIRRRHTGKSAGYGFVEMASSEQALFAVVELDGTEFAGHRLRLRITLHIPGPVPIRPVLERHVI